MESSYCTDVSNSVGRRILYRQKTWTHHGVKELKQTQSISILPANTITYNISSISINANLPKRNVYSANILKRTTLIVEKQLLNQQKLNRDNNVPKSDSDAILCYCNFKSRDNNIQQKKENSQDSSTDYVHTLSLLHSKRIVTKKRSSRSKNRMLKNRLTIKSKKTCEKDMKLPKIISTNQSLSTVPFYPVVKVLKNTGRIHCNNNTNNLKSEEITVQAHHTKQTKIYYSQKQSKNCDGIPSVPPNTPSIASLTERIQSLADVKSQRDVQTKLLKLELKQSTTEQRRMKKIQNKECERLAEEREKLIKKQRRIIYELNKIMTDYETEQYENFKTQHDGAPV